MKNSPIRPIFESASSRIIQARENIQQTRQRIAKTVGQVLALCWSRYYSVHYRLSFWKIRYRSIVIVIGLILLIVASTYTLSIFQRRLEQHISDERTLANFQALFLNIGSALIGAAAIAFSLVMFAMQVNVERTPHGLFQRLSSDVRIMAAFVGTFLLAISVACVSLVNDKLWIARATLASVWAIVLILGLFLYAYRRSLLLINPLKQLNLLIEDANREMRTWARWATRAAPLLEKTDLRQDSDAHPVGSTHDVPRLVLFQRNPAWTTGAQQAIQHAISFARRYADQGDHEVSGAALNAVVAINQHYISAKGKTFFAAHPFLDNPLTTDGFINATLEHLRQNIRIGISRGDERQIEQTLQAMTLLVQVYLQIDYSNPHALRTHADLAAGYLSEAAKSIAAHNMPDVLMENVRLMGKSAHLFLAQTGQPSTLHADEIKVIACLGAVNEKYRPVTLVAVE